ncbi:class I SAM-dependent methyltransferase [Streptomyces sp. NPDC059477]|uniref:class I SAM-dependent methyltransferase n=1 Tax=Streptomyces sp. NPDC059477 TaxID=3346847 RepID=UPI00369B5837
MDAQASEPMVGGGADEPLPGQDERLVRCGESHRGRGGGGLDEDEGVAEGSRLIDLACGTGSLAVQAARRGAVAHGVDVSEEMLAFAQARAERFGVAPHWHRGGFLDYAHIGPLADVVTTKSALHQLPDLWKQQALRNAAGYLDTRRPLRCM